MLIKNIEYLLNSSLKEAHQRKHEYILLEHLLLQICLLDEGKSIFKNLGVSSSSLIENINYYLEEKIDTTLLEEKEPLTSIMVERVINRVIQSSIFSGKKICSLIDILLSILLEKDSYSVFILKQFQINEETLTNYSQNQSLEENENLTRIEKKNSSETVYEYPKKNHQSKDINPFPQILINYEEKIKEQQLDELIGREKELEKIYQIIARRKKNNCLLIGDSGVGKTAIVEGLALKIYQQKVPPYFQKTPLYRLEVTTLMAGTKFRGELEERIKKIFDFIKKFRIILFIDDLHSFISNGSSISGTNDIIGLLKTQLNDDQIKCITSTTYQDYHLTLQKENNFYRRFEKVDVKETSPEETKKILIKAKKKYENYHQVKYESLALEKMGKLCQEYLNDKKLPDGALDLMDMSGAEAKLKITDPKKRIISEKTIERIVEKLKRVPLKKAFKEQKYFFVYLEKKLKNLIFGQNEAINTIIKSLKLAKAGLLEKDKTLGAFLFTGPTGVGKTELSRILAKNMNLHLVRLDMSEYVEQHSISKLLGAPPGYVGYNEKKNELSEEIKKHPYSLILLDEIEKAHPEVINAFLQIMDYGTLSDNQGNKIDFKNCLLIMTSNLGAVELSSNPLGFIEEEENSKDGAAIKSFFAPEFRNRLSAIIRFNFLSKGMAYQILKKFLKELNQLLEEKKIKVEWNKDVMNYLIKKGIDKKMGARPLKRIIEKEIKGRIVDEIISEDFPESSKIIFNLARKKLIYKIVKKK